MTNIAEPASKTSAHLFATDPLPGGSKVRWAVLDALTVTKRNLIALTRIPESLFFSTVQPVMFVLLFRYVFGGAIRPPGINYVEYLMPGVFVQTVAFGAVSTSVGLADDLHKGLIERFKSLPMARSAVLAGRTTADLVRNIFVIILMFIVGYAVGFRVHGPFLEVLGGVGVLLLFAYAISWGFAFVGLSAPNSETAQVMAFPLLFPMTFASSAFVPVESMPSWLQGFATYQPVSIAADAARSLMLGHSNVKILIHASTKSLVFQSVGYSLLLLLVFSPIAVWRFRSATE